MVSLEICFWAAWLVILYAYVGYGLVVYGLGQLRHALRPAPAPLPPTEPTVTLIVPAFNEAETIGAKLANCLGLDYPPDKLRTLIVSDGSTDGTPDIARRFRRVQVLHRQERLGKAAAINRAMAHVRSEIVVLSDANTALNREALREIVRHYADAAVGGVAGEKRIRRRDSTVAAGEGRYWRYESWLKRLDSELWTVVGGAGELLSFRRALFTPLEEDSILDDFVLSLRIAAQGHRVVYEPRAHATESASASVKEELKRRIRIAAGGWQSMVRLRSLLNPRAHPTLSFQYVSHRVLRWSLVPLLLALLVPMNLALALAAGPRAEWYRVLLWGQVASYGLALAGYLGDRLGGGRRVTLLALAYYFFVTNYAVVRGLVRFVAGRQPAAWERARRALVAFLAAGLTWGVALNAQERGAPVEYRLRFNAIHFDNFFQSPEGQPKTAVWASGVDGRLAVRVDRGRAVRLYAEGDAIRFPGFEPTFGAGGGVRRDSKTSAFDANVSYLWNRPTVEVGDQFGRADMARVRAEYSHRPLRAVEVIGRGEYRRQWYEPTTLQNSTTFEIGPAVRYRGFGYGLSPESGVSVGRLETRDPNETYEERTLSVGASSLLYGSRIYLAARYRYRVRGYTVDDPQLSNFGRTDRRRQLTATLAIALSRWLSCTAYYERERGTSPHQWGNFTTQYLSVGLVMRS